MDDPTKKENEFKGVKECEEKQSLPSIKTALNAFDTSEVNDKNKTDQDSCDIDDDKSLLERNDTVSSSSQSSVKINPNELIQNLQAEKDKVLSNATDNYKVHGQEITTKENVKNTSDEKDEQIVSLECDDTSTLAIHALNVIDEEKMEQTSIQETESNTMAYFSDLVWARILLGMGLLLIPIGFHLFNSLA